MTSTTLVVHIFSTTNDTMIPFVLYDTETHKVFFSFRFAGLLQKEKVTAQEKAQCVEWSIETRSNMQVQRNFRARYGRNPPLRTRFREWYKRFKEIGSCHKQKNTGRPNTSAADEQVRESFQQSPRKSF